MAQEGYGSRWKKWLLIYVGVAIVAYAVIYFAFFAHGGSGSGGGGLYLLGALPGAEFLAERTSRRRPIRERIRRRR
jgi:F0F1-type ATP synthase assembly protein I